MKTPCIKLSKAESPGQLPNGSYQVYIAYTINEQQIGDYIGVSNVQPLFDNDGSSCSLDIEISNGNPEIVQKIIESTMKHVLKNVYSIQVKTPFKKMTYDGRHPDIPWRDQNIKTMGYHYYMTPETAELGLKKLPNAIKDKPIQWTINDWPDVSKMEVFNNIEGIDPYLQTR